MTHPRYTYCITRWVYVLLLWILTLTPLRWAHNPGRTQTLLLFPIHRNLWSFLSEWIHSEVPLVVRTWLLYTIVLEAGQWDQRKCIYVNYRPRHSGAEPFHVPSSQNLVVFPPSILYPFSHWYLATPSNLLTDPIPMLSRSPQFFWDSTQGWI